MTQYFDEFVAELCYRIKSAGTEDPDQAVVLRVPEIVDVAAESLSQRVGR